MSLFQMPGGNIVDAVAGGVIVLAMLQGLIRGLSRELARLITVASSLALGLLFYRPSALFLQTHSKLSGPAAEAISFTTLVVVCVLAFAVGRLLAGKVVTVNLDIKGNKPGGILAGFLSAAGFVFCIFFAANLWPDETLHKQFFDRSILGSVLSKIMPAAGRPAGDSKEEIQADRKDAPEEEVSPTAAPPEESGPVDPEPSPAGEEHPAAREDAPEEEVIPAAAPGETEPVAAEPIVDEPPLPRKTNRHR